MWRRTIVVFRWCFAIGFWTLVVSALWAALLGVVDPPVTWTMITQSFEQEEFHRRTVDLEEISRSLPLAVIASEDQRFFHHFGFAWDRIRKAMEFNERKKGKRIRGASTISQQTAKNVFLWPGRNLVRKGLEAWFTVLIETLWTKERILEVYLNVAEMGKGVFGAEAAAQQCFDRPADRLTPAQAALITATLPSPRRFSCSKPSSYLRGRQQWVLRQMRNIGDQMDPEVRERIGARIEREGARRKK
ncbi:MAG TPA: monofunctional biosynthetic peptidoglycan transglycosylase [Flavobacteriales bacterium]|nr:monofunctional biosynthetic peptidoglycan transglycosylase [Flavobacteriales bacterium]